MNFFKLLVLALLLPFAAFCKQYTLSVCAIFQNEAPYMKEWIDYHRKVGVEHFWLYDNNSTDNYLEVLQPYIDQNIVEVIDWPSDQRFDVFTQHCFVTQPGAFTDAVKRSKGLTTWLAAIDLDEFIVPVFGNSVPAILEKFFPYQSGVVINWQCYGTSNVAKAPDGNLLEHLTMKSLPDFEWNNYIKSIVRPERVSHFNHPHYAIYLPGFYQVNTKLKPHTGGEDFDRHIDVLRINHYWTRDEWYLKNVKLPRQEKFAISEGFAIDKANHMNAIYDPISNYVK